MTIFICTSNAGKLREFRHAFGTSDTVFGIQDLVEIFVKDEASDTTMFQRPEYREPQEDCDFFAGNALQKLIAATAFLESIARAYPSSLHSESFPEHIVVDDSGLCVPALQFEPGVHSARYGGLPRCDSRNRSRLRAAIANLEFAHSPSLPDLVLFGQERRARAFFLCILLSLSFKKQSLGSFQGASFARTLEDLLRKRCWPSRDLELKSFKQEAQCLVLEGSGAPVNGSVSVTINAHYGLCHGYVSDTEQNLLPNEGHGYDAMFYHESKPELSFASVPIHVKNQWSHRGLAVKQLVENLKSDA